MAFADPLLYVYDENTRRIWTLDVSKEGSEPRSEFEPRTAVPSHMAVSPEGRLVATLEGRELVFQQAGMEPVRYSESQFPDPTGLAFSAWDTVQVLDRARGALVTITFNRLKGGALDFFPERESSETALSEPRWRAMTVFEGTVYLADGSRVFAYMRSDDLLIPILGIERGHEEISQIALTRDELFLLDDDHLGVLPRPQPVDLTLDGSPEASQAALLEFYWYLAREKLLPVREVLVRRDYKRLADFLLAENVVLTPITNDSDREIRVLQSMRKPGETNRPKLELASNDWNDLFCWLNSQLAPGLCANAPGPVLDEAMSSGTTVWLPDLVINRRLTRETILIEGESLETYVDRLVFAPELRKRVTPELILRLNPNFSKVPAEQVYGIRSGSVVIPVEKWAVTAAVPALEYSDFESELWTTMRRFDGVSLYARSSFATKSLAAAPYPHPRPAPPVPCDELKEHWKKWRQTIRYPGALAPKDMAWPELATNAVRVGVLEYASTVLMGHDVFSRQGQPPTWHSALNLDLVPKPDPAGFTSGTQVVQDLATYSKTAHHGTHVAAIIGGRSSECWSGLLPAARLVLIDLDDRAKVQRSIANAVSVDTNVFNISQEFNISSDADDQEEELFRTIEGLPFTLFVAAAGNSTRDLDDASAVPAPAVWGARENVVVVAATDWNGTILPKKTTPEGERPGSNFGKKFVDLLAPGEDVYSASAEKSFGPASGTSQAAPQVAAAAAVLVDRQSHSMTVGDAKARLIATARWRTDYQGHVWGGMLDFASAVAYPDIHHLQTLTDAPEGKYHTFVEKNDPKIRIVNLARYYERDKEQGDVAPDSISFSGILSLQRNEDGKYRVVLRERLTNHLKIILDAQLADEDPLIGGPKKIQCKSYERFNPVTLAFEPDTVGCSEGLSINDIARFVRGDDYHIEWEE
jgi:hypothetical protein